MLKRFAVALVAFASVATAASDAPRIIALGAVPLKYDWDAFGGLSGLEVDPSGTRFWAVSDIGFFYSGALERSVGPQGILKSAQILQGTEIVFGNRDGALEKIQKDTEGFAIHADGSLMMSAEHTDLLWSFDADLSNPRFQRLPARPKRAQPNRGYEALALTPDGMPVVLAEVSGSVITPFGVYKLGAQGTWEEIFEIPRSASFVPVGADFGPDGNLYVLMRAFNGFAFASQIARVVFAHDTPVAYEMLYTSRFGTFGNLEGLGVWQAANGQLRLIAVADDNFRRLQRSQMVEFVLKE